MASMLGIKHRSLAALTSLLAVLVLGIGSVVGQEQAISLDGDEDYVDVPHSPGLAVSGAMTVEAWIKIGSYPNQPAEIVNKKRREPWAGFTLHLQNGYLQFSIATGTAGPSFYTAEAPWTYVVPGQWTHVAGVSDGSTVSILVNGVVRHSAPCSAPLLGADTNPLRFGYDCEAPLHNPASEFTGLIDEVRFWTLARSPAQVQATMFNEVDSLPGLLGTWHLDGNAIDSTGGHHGFPAGNTSFVPSTAPVTCAATGLCYTLPTPVPIGTLATFAVSSATSNAPIFVFVDVTLGSVPLGIWGATQIAFSPFVAALADPTGIWGPGLTTPYTNAAGSWSLSLPVPNDPALLALTLYSEAYVMDFFAPNGFFRQSNLLTITFQP